MHPKMGSTLESRGPVRVAGKPSDEPLRKGETQSPQVREQTDQERTDVLNRGFERHPHEPEAT